MTPDPRQVAVRATDPRRALRLRDHLLRWGACAQCDGRARDVAVVVAAGATVDDALGVAPVGWRVDDTVLVLVADDVSPAATRRAVRLGVRVVLDAARATPTRLLAAIHAAHDDQVRVPAEVLSPAARSEPAPSVSALTRRQSTVVALMAEGCSNGEVATALSCSEHTVKNVVYELMGRLRARNRAQAVAHAVRAGLI